MPSLPRLYGLRAAYLFIALGLGIQVWPGIMHHDKPWELMEGVVQCILGAICLLALLGLRYPLRMLPLLFFELVWKTLWLSLVAWPAWSAHHMDAGTTGTTIACLMAAVFLVAIPWRYVLATYVLQPADRWR